MNQNPRTRLSFRTLLATLAVCLLAFSIAVPLPADEVEELINGAGDAWRSGELKKSLLLFL